MNRSVKLLAVLGVLVLVAVGYYATRPSGVTHSSVITQECVDLATGENITVKHDVRERAPFVNPATGKSTVYPWFFDETVGKRFVPDLVVDQDGVPRLPMIPRNPATGESGGQWVPNAHQDEYVGDEELPKLPTK